MSTEQNFASLGLAPAILQAIAETGYSTPTPIQAQAIPLVLKGGDLLAAAQTGTGKTAGFTLPILHLLASNPKQGLANGRPRCLILTPTRELAAQVEESVQTYGKHLPLKSMVMFGGVNINPQTKQLRRPLDILVATPGRLLDHVGQKTLDLSGVEILVLDEADRMLDMGFIRDIRKILALLPAKRQNLLFSATFSDEIKALADGLLNNPGCVEVARRNTTSELVQQTVHLVPQAHKRDLLSHLIRQHDWKQVLVFTRTKHGANRLADKLGKDGIPAAAIHGNKSQNARTKALADFKDGSLPVLVATDIAARGLDIDQLPQVVNFELPNVPEDYVHRIGRTGRAGRSGLAITLAGFRDRFKIRNIEHFTQQRIGEAVVEGHEPRSKPPSTGGYGGGFGGGRGGYGGRGGDRGFGGGFGGGQGARGRFERDASAGAGGYRGRSAGGAGFGGERSFDRAPADRPRQADDRGGSRFADDRPDRFDRSDRAPARDREYAPRFDAPRAADDRSGARFERDVAPREGRLPRVENERSARWGAERGDRPERSESFGRPTRDDRPGRFERAPYAGRADHGESRERSFGGFERRERDSGFSGDRGFGRGDRGASAAWTDRPAPARGGFSNQFDAPFKRPQAGFAERSERAPRLPRVANAGGIQ